MILNQQNIKDSNYDEDEISIKELIYKIKEWNSFFISKWRLIFLASFLGGLIGFLIAFFDKPTYKAVLTFAMEEDNSSGGGGLGGALGLASSFGIDLGSSGGGSVFAASNIAELMKSRLIVEKVLLEPMIIEGKKSTLAEFYIEINKLRDGWLSNPLLKDIHFLSNKDSVKFSLQQDSIIQNIHISLIDKENLFISQKDKKVTILTIEVKSKNELFSKLFCENLAKETSEFYIQTKSKKARINANVLQKQVDSIRSELNGAIIGVASETDNVYNLNPAFNVKGTPSKKRQIDVQANTAILTNLTVQLELAKITLRKETPLIQLIDKPVFPLQKEKLGKIKSFLIGWFLSGFLVLTYLIFKKLYSKILTD